MKTNFRTFLVHIVIWIFYLLTVFLSSSTWDNFFLAVLISNNAPLIILFYLNIFFVFPRYLEQKKFVLLSAWLFLFNLVLVPLRFALLLLITRGSLADLLDANLTSIILGLVRINLLFIGISLAYWFWKRGILIERQRKQLEKEISDAKLTGLKNQINPHFLYNTLSFLYTKALPLSKELANAIYTLSEMMRYTLSEIDEDEKIPLEKEIKHLENFIQIHQMRFNKSLQIDYSVTGETSGLKIMPLLLLTFIENAFKHGQMNDAKSPLIIKINVVTNKMEFISTNKKSTGIKEKSSGIGLNNIKSRLLLAYPDKYQLTIDDSKLIFNVHLSIQL